MKEYIVLLKKVLHTAVPVRTESAAQACSIALQRAEHAQWEVEPGSPKAIDVAETEQFK